MKNYLSPLVIIFLISACGPSSQEKEEIAVLACNIMGESRNMDASYRIKEINNAREQIGEERFLGKDEEIKKSFEFNLCKELVLNDEYEIKLNERYFALKKKAEEERIIREKENEEERIRQEQYKKEYLLQEQREKKERDERIRIYEEKKAEEERIKREKKAEEERTALELRENALLKYRTAVQDEILKYDFYKGIGEKYRRKGLEVKRSGNYSEDDWTKLAMSFWVQTDEGVISNEEGVELTIHVRSFNIDFKDEELRDLKITCAQSSGTQIGQNNGTDHMRFEANQNCFTFQNYKEWMLFIDKFRGKYLGYEYRFNKIPDDAYDVELFVDGITTNSIEPYEFECRAYEKDLKIRCNPNNSTEGFEPIAIKLKE